MKVCKYCGIEKNPDQFHKNKTAKDGVQSKCKICVSAYWKEYHLKNIEKGEGNPYWLERKKKIGLAAARKYYQKNKEKWKEKWKARYLWDREKIIARHKIYCQTDKGKNMHREANNRHRKKYPEKYKARTAAYNNIKINGKSCESCGSFKNLHRHHHNGYDRVNWLNVQILCRTCHHRKHSKEMAV